MPPSFPIPNVQSCKSQQAEIVISLTLFEIAKSLPLFFVSTQTLGKGTNVQKYVQRLGPFPGLQSVLGGQRSSASIY